MPFDAPALTETSPNFGTLLLALETANLLGPEGFDEKTRHRLLLDVRQFCRWSGRDPESLPTHPRTLQSLTQDWTGATFGVSDKRFANVLSSVRKALVLATGLTFERKPLSQLEGPWSVLVADLRKSWARPVLSPFIRWCASHGIDPDQVTAQTAEDYLYYRAERDVRRNPAKLSSQLRNAWARAQRDVPAWPNVSLDIGYDKPSNLLLSWAAFPESLTDEVTAYRTARGVRNSAGSGGDPSLRQILLNANPDLAGGATSLTIDDPLSKSTLDEQINTLRLAASTLIQTDGRPADELTSIAEITTPGCAAATAEEALNRNGRNSSYAGNIIKNLRSVRARWIGLSDGEKQQFKLLRRKAEEGVDLRSMRPQNRAKLSQFDDPARLRRLISWPRQQMDELEKERKRTGRVTQSMALDAQACVMGILLMSLPVRRGTLTATRIDGHFRWPLPGKRGTATLSYSPAETKTNRPAAVVLSEWKVDLLRAYLEHYRPRLLMSGDPGNPYLFPGHVKGRPKSYSKIAETMTKRVRHQVGVHLNLHFYRHLMASLLLRQSRSLEMARALLGHSDGSAVTQLYAEMEQRWSAEDLDRITSRMADAYGRHRSPGNGR